MSTTPDDLEPAEPLPEQEYAATAAIAANWLPITAAIAMLSREPHAESIDPKTSRDARDHDEGQRRAGHPQAPLQEERDDDHDDAHQPRAQRDPGDRHERRRLAGRHETESEGERRDDREQRGSSGVDRALAVAGGVVAAVVSTAGPSRASATKSKSPAGTSARPGSSVDRITPVAMTASISPATMPIVSPSATAMSAATAPSVATIGATIETLPIRNAAYASWRPTT